MTGSECSFWINIYWFLMLCTVSLKQLDIMVKFYVVSLFSNVPLDDAIQPLS